MTPTYLGDIELNEETLAHYGVKGMKWRVRKAKGKLQDLYRNSNYAKKKREQKYIASHLADEYISGKRSVNGIDRNGKINNNIKSINAPNFRNVSAETTDGNGNKKRRKTKFVKFLGEAAKQELRRQTKISRYK